MVAIASIVDMFIKSGLLANIANIGYNLVLLVVVLLFAGAVLWVMVEYKHRAILVNKNGRMRFDRLREYTDRQGKKHRKLLFKKKETIPETESDESFIVGRNNGFIFYETSKGTYVPMKLNLSKKISREGNIVDAADLKTVDTDVDWWALNLHAEREAEYASSHFWERFGGAITLGIVVVFVFMMVWFTIDYSESVLTQVNSQMGPLVDRLGEIAQNLKNMNTQNIGSFNR